MKAGITIIILMVVYSGSVLGNCPDDEPEIKRNTTIAVNAPPSNALLQILY